MVAPELVVLDVHETLADLEPLRQRFTGSGAPERLLVPDGLRVPANAGHGSRC